MREWLRELDHKRIWWYGFCLVFLLCATVVFAVQHSKANHVDPHAKSDTPRSTLVVQPHNQPDYKAPITNKDFLPILNRLQKRTKTGKPIMYLSFDDGPSKYTAELLGVLEKYHVKATFFMLGLYVQKHPEYVQPVVNAGHEVGNHTYSHTSMVGMGKKKIQLELNKTAALIKTAAPNVNGDGALELFRPPYGAKNKRVQITARRLGYRIAIWNIDPEDWRGFGPKKIARNIRTHAKPGGVVLAHDGGGNQKNTIKAFDTIIPQLQARGYEFWTLSQGL